ncbi:MAG TPA: bifunctional riboflavin kinase/FAD synthetase [Terriglobales bacterium]|nr:bifunctional riboflavin kinase/FAD synthetase [Terriglobales bacterium]
MKTFYKLDDIPSDFGPSLVSVGNFDGVHRAHVRVLRAIVARARDRRAKSIAVTFEPHPMRILRPDAAPKLLTPTSEKLRLLETTGIDAALVVPFTRDLSLMPPRDFVARILCEKLQALEAHEGYNFRFGHKAAGDVKLLQQLGDELGFELVIYPEMCLRGLSVSSTRIRELVREGDVRRARYLLGRAFSIQSLAGRGRGYGSKYTVPTINLSRYDELVPRDGVYVTRTRVGQECFDSVTNVGNRPTFGSDSFAIESHLLNFHPLKVTAETEIEVYFLYRLRDEIKFSSVEMLREQITRDVGKAQRYFALTQARLL